MAFKLGHATWHMVMSCHVALKLSYTMWHLINYVIPCDT